MDLSAHGLVYRKKEERLVASIRQPAGGREEILALFQELAQIVKPENRAGDFFWINHYINSLESGFDVEVGVPVRMPVADGRVSSKILPGMQVLCAEHQGPASTIGESYSKFRTATGEAGLISEEFIIESFAEIEQLLTGPIEVQYVLHDWAGLFRKNLSRVVGESAAEKIFGEMDSITVETDLSQRHELTLCAVSRLVELGNEFDSYDAISSCAHVFPDNQTMKLNNVYQAIYAQTGDKLAAIDAVIEFMEADPGWGVEIFREGEVIYTAKNPRDRTAHEAAKTDAERRKAYCFCPLIRDHLEEEIPPEFCYCGSGWFRKQWEDASEKPVSIEIVKSLLKGNERCQYAIKIFD
ncbi:MAG: GyrI-like domain-containing protein [Chloroflexota bacterium]